MVRGFYNIGKVVLGLLLILTLTHNAYAGYLKEINGSLSIGEDLTVDRDLYVGRDAMIDNILTVGEKIEIFHTGSHGYISNDTGKLFIDTASTTMEFKISNALMEFINTGERKLSICGGDVSFNPSINFIPATGDGQTAYIRVEDSFDAPDPLQISAERIELESPLGGVWLLSSDLTVQGNTLLEGSLSVDHNLSVNNNLYVEGTIEGHGYYSNAVTKTGTYTATTTDDKILCNGTFTLTLPASAGVINKEYALINIGTGTITLDGNGFETINGELLQYLYPDEAVNVSTDGSNWFVH